MVDFLVDFLVVILVVIFPPIEIPILLRGGLTPRLRETGLFLVNRVFFKLLVKVLNLLIKFNLVGLL